MSELPERWTTAIGPRLSRRRLFGIGMAGVGAAISTACAAERIR